MRFIPLALALALAACAIGPQPLDLSGSRVDVPPIPRWAELQALLKEERYDELHEVLERYRAAALWDVERGEEPLRLAYQAFEVADPAVLEGLHRWVRKRPRSWHARTARAHCYLEFAFQARGVGWFKDLSPQQVAGLMKYHAAAAVDARKALELQPKNVAAHYVMLAIARHGTSVDFDTATAAALEAFPDSYIVRFETVWSLQPRWKGKEDGYTRLDEFVKQSQEHASANPRLRRLLAMPYWARGADAYKDGKYDEAVGLYNAAFAIADDRLFLRLRALALAAKHDYRSAFADAQRYREMAPPTTDGGTPDEIKRDVFASAVRWINTKLLEGPISEAVKTLDIVLEHSPRDAELRLMRAMVRCRLGDAPAATRDFELARRDAADPGHVESLHVACMMSGGNPEEAIRRMQRKLLKEAGNARVQRELAALYSLAGDVMSAIEAYRHACELGSPDACRRIERLRAVAKRTQHLPWPDALAPHWRLHPQERLATAAEYEAFIATLKASSDFAGGGPPVKFTRRVLPEFPMWARNVPQGSVALQIFFGADGTVAGASVESGDPEGYFELAALRAVLRWKIEPRKAGLKARQEIDFSMPTRRPVDPGEDILLGMR